MSVRSAQETMAGSLILGGGFLVFTESYRVFATALSKAARLAAGDQNGDRNTCALGLNCGLLCG